LDQQACAKLFTVANGLLKLLIRVRGGEAASCRFGLRVSLVLLCIRGGLIGVSSGGAIPVGIRLGIQFLLLCGGVVPFGLRLAGVTVTALGVFAASCRTPDSARGGTPRAARLCWTHLVGHPDILP